MKALTLLSIGVLFSTSNLLHAQVVVDSLGKVGIGNDSPSSFFSVGNHGHPSYTATFSPINNKKAVFVWNRMEDNSNTCGIHIANLFQTNKTTIGLEVYPYTTYGTTTNYTYGIKTLGGGSTSNNIGIYAGLVSNQAPNAAGIYGATSSANSALSTVGGVYAGFFAGDVYVKGTLTSTAIVSPSLNTLFVRGNQAAISKYSDDEQIIDKLADVSLMELRSDNTRTGFIQNNSISSSDNIDIDDTICFDETEVSNYYLPQIRYGLNADELRSIYPELVYEDNNGNISINYIEMVPLLVQSIKELKAEIEELKGTGTKARKVKANTHGSATVISDELTDLLSMSQNDPNPFTTETTIALVVPEGVKAASVIVYDLSGKKVKEIEVLGRGETAINMTAEGLTPGMYLYSLIADGKVISTKRMILN